MFSVRKIFILLVELYCSSFLIIPYRPPGSIQIDLNNKGVCTRPYNPGRVPAGHRDQECSSRPPQAEVLLPHLPRRLESGVLSLPLCNETAILRVIVYWLSIRNEKVGKLRDKVGFCWTLCFDAWRPALDINIFCGTMDTAFSVNVYRFQFYCVSRTFVRYFLETDRLHILESRHGQNMLFKS